MWTAISIFVPVCFGLIGISYASVEILKLEGMHLLPLALASLLLYGFGMTFVSRYAGYNKAILKRLRQIEKEKGMNLHKQIKEEDEKRRLKWNLGYVKWILFLCLVGVWGLRLLLAPLVKT